MTKTRNAPERRPTESRLGKLADAALEGVRRMIEALSPQPQLQPVPVRARNRRAPPQR